jgi:hypothetical protein
MSRVRAAGVLVQLYGIQYEPSYFTLWLPRCHAATHLHQATQPGVEALCRLAGLWLVCRVLVGMGEGAKESFEMGTSLHLTCAPHCWSSCPPCMLLMPVIMRRWFII